jgi:hypothetical protein
MTTDTRIAGEFARLKKIEKKAAILCRIFSVAYLSALELSCSKLIGWARRFHDAAGCRILREWLVAETLLARTGDGRL